MPAYTAGWHGMNGAPKQVENVAAGGLAVVAQGDRAADLAEPLEETSPPDGGSLSWYAAGLAALLLEAEPKAKVSRLEAAILGSCVRPRGMSAERAGRGIPSAPKALEAL